MGLMVVGAMIVLFLITALIKSKQARPQSKLDWFDMHLYSILAITFEFPVLFYE